MQDDLQRLRANGSSDTTPHVEKCVANECTGDGLAILLRKLVNLEEAFNQPLGRGGIAGTNRECGFYRICTSKRLAT
ncbi:hypothetical protein ASF58_23045 [Methylobacterium sp. Leaf125]|nr:hypothetical protein ASF58_23045 [Methylobacterium sp. Leaf125]